MTLSVGGSVFTGLVWKRSPLRASVLCSGPYALVKSRKLHGWKLILSGEKVLGYFTTLREAKQWADDNARAALVFGARPVKVTR